MIELKLIDLKKLKEEIKLLNDGGQLESKIKIVATSKENLVAAFKGAIEYLADNEKDFPESAADFYNACELGIPDGEAGEPDKKSDDKKPADAKVDAKADAKADAKKPADKKPKTPPKASKKIASFEDIQERCKEPSNPTAYMDKLMLTGGKIETLIAKLKEHCSETKSTFSGFRTVSSVNRHIEYREEHGWVFEKDDDKVKLVGFKAKK